MKRASRFLVIALAALMLAPALAGALPDVPRNRTLVL